MWSWDHTHAVHSNYVSFLMSRDSILNAKGDLPVAARKRSLPGGRRGLSRRLSGYDTKTTSKKEMHPFDITQSKTLVNQRTSSRTYKDNSPNGGDILQIIYLIIYYLEYTKNYCNLVIKR
uniref:Zinc finger protein 354C n=1 Tax=Rousettus aegyptiacus TaxID=9407 RepID=A0A7J8FP87_ROUAE|nr:zinc finger protein 354C [Rousettus aegyptiacus]